MNIQLENKQHLAALLFDPIDHLIYEQTIYPNEILTALRYQRYSGLFNVLISNETYEFQTPQRLEAIRELIKEQEAEGNHQRAFYLAKMLKDYEAE